LWTLLPAAAAAQGKAADDPRFKDAMAAYADRAKLRNHMEATRRLAQLARDFPKEREIQVWCARTSYYCAHRLIEDKDKMLPVSKLGLACGKRLQKHHPGDYEGELWSALTRFKHAVADSFIPPLGEAENVAKFLEKLVAKSPDNFAAYMLLGAMYRELPGSPISIGDEEKAVEILEKAVSLAPTDAELLLELAAAYAEVGKKAKARATYQKCIVQGTGPPELEWETADAKAYALKMLRALD